jgi:hypothetical protein
MSRPELIRRLVEVVGELSDGMGIVTDRAFGEVAAQDKCTFIAIYLLYGAGSSEDGNARVMPSQYGQKDLLNRRTGRA